MFLSQTVSDLVYGFKNKLSENLTFRNNSEKLINRYKRISYSLDNMRQTACLVINPIIVDGYASLFNCTTAVRASNSMTLDDLSLAWPTVVQLLVFIYSVTQFFLFVCHY